MAKGLQQQAGGQNLPADVSALTDQLERHCLAPDGSLVSKSAYYDLQLVAQRSLFFLPCFFGICFSLHPNGAERTEEEKRNGKIAFGVLVLVLLKLRKT